MKKILFYINPFSGNRLGEKIILWLKKDFLEWFGEYQFEIRTTVADKNQYSINDEEQIVIAAGGDGTISTVIHSLREHKKSVFSFIPLGTGNDFARSVYGRALTIKTKSDLRNHLTHILIDSVLTRFDILSLNHLSMACYYSVGCDAAVVKNFSFLRIKYPKVFSNRKMNKIFYFFIGLKNIFFRIEGKIQIHYVNQNGENEELFIPERIKSLIISNIKYYGGGSQVGDDISMSDGFFEITIIRNSLILSLFMMSRFSNIMRKIYRNFGTTMKVKNVILKLNGIEPAQIDGEYIKMDQTEIQIKNENSIKMIY